MNAGKFSAHRPSPAHIRLKIESSPGIGQSFSLSAIFSMQTPGQQFLHFGAQLQNEQFLKSRADVTVVGGRQQKLQVSQAIGISEKCE